MKQLTSLVSPKVIAAAAGAGASGALSTLLLWIIGALVFGGSWSANDVATTLSLVPTPISVALAVVLAVVGAAVPGYNATDPARKDPPAYSDGQNYDDPGSVLLPGAPTDGTEGTSTTDSGDEIPVEQLPADPPAPAPAPEPSTEGGETSEPEDADNGADPGLDTRAQG